MVADLWRLSTLRWALNSRRNQELFGGVDIPRWKFHQSVRSRDLALLGLGLRVGSCPVAQFDEKIRENIEKGGKGREQISQHHDNSRHPTTP